MEVAGPVLEEFETIQIKINLPPCRGGAVGRGIKDDSNNPCDDQASYNLAADKTL